MAEREGCALVTGGSRGIGAAIAHALGADGWAVGVNYRSDKDAADKVVSEIESNGGRAVALGADVVDPDAADKLFSELESHFDAPVLVLVNNAGISRDDLTPSLDDEQWNAVIETDLTAAFRLTRRALKAMLRARNGRIVNISSVVALRANAGAGQLRGGQGRPDRDDQDGSCRGRPPRCHDQRGRSRLDRDRDDRGDLDRPAAGGAGTQSGQA